MRTWLLSAVAAVGLGLGGTASNASAAVPTACAPVQVCAPVAPMRGHVVVRQRVYRRHFHRYAHFRQVSRRFHRVCR